MWAHNFGLTGHNHVGDCVAQSQWMVEATQDAESDYGGSKSKITNAFWRQFFRKIGIKLGFSMAFHFKMNRKMEHVNEVSNQYLRNLVSANK